MIDLLINIIKESINLWTAMSPYLLLGMFVAGILHAYLGPAFISRHLGGTGFASILKATIFGIPLPVCSCGVIPVAASLKKEGASRSSTLSFLVSTPTTGVDSILATYSLMGPLFTIFRPLAAFFSGITIGLLNRIFNPEKIKKKEDEHDHPRQSQHLKIKEVFRYGFLELTADIGKWLVIGVLIGGILTAAIPNNLFEKFLPYPFLHFIVMLILAIPLYVCATGSIPIAAALIQKGFSPGAALVFLIAGPATNTVTLSFVRSKLGKKAFYLYLGSIIAVSILLGWIMNLTWNLLGGNQNLISPHGGNLPIVLRLLSGIALLFLIIVGMLRSRERAVPTKHTLLVPDLKCKHCKTTIENKLNNTDGVSRVVVDIESKTVGVDGDLPLEDIENAIRETGYTPKRLSKQ